MLEDRPGELARLGEALGGAGVIEGVYAVGMHDRGVIVTSDNDRARQALGM